MTDGGSGFRVHPDTIYEAGRSAGGIGDDLRSLAAGTTAACDMLQPAPSGLDFGSTLREIGPMWERHLNSLADAVQGTSGSLHATYGNYLSTDSDVHHSLLSILR